MEGKKRGRPGNEAKQGLSLSELGRYIREIIFGVPLSQLPQELFGSDVIVEGQLNKVLPVSGM